MAGRGTPLENQNNGSFCRTRGFTDLSTIFSDLSMPSVSSFQNGLELTIKTATTSCKKT